MAVNEDIRYDDEPQPNDDNDIEIKEDHENMAFTEDEVNDDNQNEQQEHDSSREDQSVVEETTEEETTSPRRSTRERKVNKNYVPSFGGKKYGTQFHQIAVRHLFAQIHEDKKEADANYEQMSFQKGKKLFGERAIASMLKEYQHMEDMAVVAMIDPDSLSAEQRKKALRTVNLIKQKRNKVLKGRLCANGSPHRRFVPREEARSPTISLEALMVSLMIDAYENRKVSIVDVPGAYLQTDIPEGKFVLLLLENEFVDIMCKVNPEYTEYVRTENGKKVLDLQVKKAIYGMIELALLWYELYTSVMTELGFELNPYDLCVANKIINGKQCTVAWYVDDNRISHVEQEVVDEIVGKIEERFPGLTVEKGNAHSFLGIKIKYMDNGKVDINMREYIREAIDEFGEEITKVVYSPAARWLFKVNENARKLTGRRLKFFLFNCGKVVVDYPERKTRLYDTNFFFMHESEVPGHRGLEKVVKVAMFFKTDNW